MRRLGFIGGACAPLLSLVLLTPCTAVASKPWVAPATARGTVGSTSDTGRFLPDSRVLGRVGTRAIRVFDFRDGYFNSDPQIRPKQDSLGRVDFLRSMVKKEVLGEAAVASGRQLTFEERAELRGFRNTILANLLFVRTVEDSSAFSEDSLRHVYSYYGYDLKLRLLYFADRAEAEAVRLKLVRGTMTWSAAAAKHGAHTGAGPAGELDWTKFESLPPELGLQIWPLKPGEVSPIILGANGYHLVQAAERRPRSAPVWEALRPLLRMTLHGMEADTRRTRMMDEAKRGLDVVYDSTNVRWASSFFHETRQMVNDGFGGSTLSLDPNMPEFAPDDTGRVVVRWKYGRLSLGDVLRGYSDLQPLTRPGINTPERFMNYVDALVVEPQLLDMAIAHGLEQDSTAKALIERKREEILVTRMVEDSVFTRISVLKQERQDYYKKHPNDFVTYPAIRYAVIVRGSRAAADSVKQRLDGGIAVETVLREDSLAGEARSGIKESHANEPVDFKKQLFEEMRPGASVVLGPDKTKAFAVLHLISFDPGHTLKYEEVEGMIDESVRNLKSEKALEAFIGRLAKRYRVELHPEMVMRIRLTDPASDNF